MPPAGAQAQMLQLQRSAGNAAAVQAMRTGVLARSPGATLETPAGQQTHKVATGESLKSIAKKYGVTTEALMKANPGKVQTWKGTKGDVLGFTAGEVIVIPSTASQPAAPAPANNPGPVSAADRPSAEVGGGIGSSISYAIDWWSKAWDRFWEDDPPVPNTKPEDKKPEEKKPAAPPAGGATGGTTTTTPATTPADVIRARVADKTFSQNVTVNSTKRDGSDQLRILRNYCKKNKAALDKYVADKDNDWLKDSLDWDKLETATMADESIWLPFFFALYYAGGGPTTKSDKRTLPLVASPKQTTWVDKKGTTRTANASPHIAGKAMDVDADDLTLLEKELRTKIPEFSATGAFPIKSIQPEKAPGQNVLHVNFKNVVF